MSPRRGAASTAVVSADDIRGHLTSRRKEALVDLLMDQVGRDELLREQLMLRVARRDTTAVDVGPLYSAIDHAVGSIAEDVDWQDAPVVAQAVDDIVDRIEALLAEGHAAEVVELAAHGLAAAKGAFELVDDSGGELGAAAGRLGALHLAACRKARPDPGELAGWLFGEHLNDDYGTFVASVADHGRVLGARGRAAYRRLAEAEGAKVPVLRAGDDRQRTYGQARITSIMEDLARAGGDTDELAEVMSRDPSHSDAHLRIAEVLREFLADDYHGRGRDEEAMALGWAEFDEHPVLGRYQALKAHADPAGVWPAWREKAVARLRAEANAAKRRARDRPCASSDSGTDHSELVRVFLWEGEVEAAWYEATAGGCSESLWRELATRREQGHPEESRAIYQRHVELVLAQKVTLAYEEAVELLLRVRAIMRRLGRTHEFAAYPASVRAAHRLKRNFMKLLDARTW